VHELSVAGALLRLVEERARERGALRVLRVHVRVGELSGVAPELLAPAWEVVRTRGSCAGAELAIQPEPVRWCCAGCAATVPAGGALRCAACGGGAELAAGAALLLERIEMEVA
jgi:hydrogenase nickel incorporation protein HypA/HybF